MNIEVKAKTNKGRNRIPSIEGEVYYVPVIDGKEYNYCAETADMAMLIGLGIKYDGLNSQFPRMAARMLGIDTIWGK